VYHCSEQARLKNAGDPTFTGEQLLDKKMQIEAAGSIRSHCYLEYEHSIVETERTLIALKNLRAMAAYDVGRHCDTKVALNKLERIAHSHCADAPHPQKVVIIEDSECEDSECEDMSEYSN
jgi:hypothetical protein